MKMLLHICCAPCTIYPLSVLMKDGHDLYGLYYNPNIHPYLEYKKRLETLEMFAVREGLRLIPQNQYPMENFLRNVAFREEDRCSYCYFDRLDFAAHIARRGKFEAFTTTLLYSKYQKHEMIAAIGNSVAKKHGISFYYRDFREGWSEGVRISKELGMYRQPYCGCVYSEKVRYYKKKWITHGRPQRLNAWQ